MSEAEQSASGTWYFVSMASMHTDGTIVVPATSVNEGRSFGGVTLVEPDDANYEFWRWLIANREVFPEVSPDNAAAVLQAFHQAQAEQEPEQKATEDHGLPDS